MAAVSRVGDRGLVCGLIADLPAGRSFRRGKDEVGGQASSVLLV